MDNLIDTEVPENYFELRTYELEDECKKLEEEIHQLRDQVIRLKYNIGGKS